jgi:hypothetical protein
VPYTCTYIGTLAEPTTFYLERDFKNDLKLYCMYICIRNQILNRNQSRFTYVRYVHISETGLYSSIIKKGAMHVRGVVVRISAFETDDRGFKSLLGCKVLGIDA